MKKLGKWRGTLSENEAISTDWKPISTGLKGIGKVGSIRARMEYDNSSRRAELLLPIDSYGGEIAIGI